MSIRITFDGACDNNSVLKLVGIGVAVWIDGVRHIEYNVARMVEIGGTNNTAEYRAFLAGLRIALKLQGKARYSKYEINMYGDSQLIVNQFNGDWRCKYDHLKKLLKKAKTLAANLDNLHVSWIRRNFNEEADLLSKKGIKDYIEKNYTEE